MELETNRLIIRRFREDDFEDYYETVSPYTDEQMKRRLFLKATDWSLKGIKNIKKIIEPESEFHFLYRFNEIEQNRRAEKDRFFTILKSPLEFAVVLKPIMKVVGKVAFWSPLYYYPMEYSYSNCKEIGVVLNRRVRNQGLMTEAVSSLVGAIFDQTDIQAVYSRILADNQASLRLFDKCGFKYLYEREELVGLDKKMVITKGISKADKTKENS